MFSRRGDSQLNIITSDGRSLCHKHHGSYLTEGGADRIMLKPACWGARRQGMAEGRLETPEREGPTPCVGTCVGGRWGDKLASVTGCT